MRPRPAAVFAAGLAAGLALGAASSALAEQPKVQNPNELTKVLKRLYGKLPYEDSINRNAAVDELQGIIAKEKDKKNSSLKNTQWWSAQILESMYTGDVLIKQPAKTKNIDKMDVECLPQGEGRAPAKATIFYRGPSGYAPKRSTPLLVSFVDAKTDPKAYLEKNWVPFEAMAKDWILVCVPESPAFDVKKDRVAPARVIAAISQTYNVDPNRIYIEGVGSACATAQLAASLAVPDRLAGLILRNPADVAAIDNCGLFPTVVVKGPEGADKATAVHAKYKAAYGEARAIEVTAPDVASVEGPNQLVADWLRDAKPREATAEYSWVATFDKDNICPNPWTGTLWIVSPVKREEPTTVKVRYSRETNTVAIDATNLGEFEVCMNDDLVDLDKEVAVVVNGTPVATRVFERSVQGMLLHADNFWEYGRLFPAKYRDFVRAQVAAQAPGGGKDAPGGGDKK